MLLLNCHILSLWTVSLSNSASKVLWDFLVRKAPCKFKTVPVPLKLPRNNVIPSILETQHDAGLNLHLSLAKYILALHQDVLATALK